MREQYINDIEIYKDICRTETESLRGVSMNESSEISRLV